VYISTVTVPSLLFDVLVVVRTAILEECSPLTQAIKLTNCRRSPKLKIGLIALAARARHRAPTTTARSDNIASCG
jgi:hypothetical protein